MKQEFNINIEEFLQKFKQEYGFLYDHHDRVAGYQEAVDAFDAFAEKHEGFVSEFEIYRGDIITSDREAAAFMFTLDALT